MLDWILATRQQVLRVWLPVVLLVAGCSRPGAAPTGPLPASGTMPAPGGALAVAAMPAPQVPPTTSGRVACGAVGCAATTEFCFERKNTSPRCLPIAQEQDYGRNASSDDALYLCDDASDCPMGQQCCGGTWGGTGPAYHACTADRCADHVVCIPGGACPAGLHCDSLPRSQGRALCVPANPGVACGSVRCQGPTPRCCLRSDTLTGRCLPAHTDRAVCNGDGEALLECKNRADCGGYFCCTNLLGSTACWSTCPGAAVAVACETFADCPPDGPGPGGMPQRYDRCEAGACTGDLCHLDGTWRSCAGL